METRSNLKLVAAVTGLLLFGLMMFTYFLSSAAGSFDALYEIRFGKSVSGLTAGSTVTMSGVPVGQITAISVDQDNPESVLITVALDEKLPIRQGVKADISRSLLNGDAALILLPSSEGMLVNPEGRGEMGRIASVGGDTSRDPAQEAAQIARKLDDAVKGLHAPGRAKIGTSLARTADRTADWEATVLRFTNAIPTGKVKSVASDLADAGKGADRLRRSIDSSDDDVAKVRSEIRKFGADADAVARSVEAARPSIRAASRDLRETSKTIKDIGDSVSDAKERVNEALPDDR
jgi:phospholipid/cholesterol/gamma-HCH transport system substrate-binding protein